MKRAALTLLAIASLCGVAVACSKGSDGSSGGIDAVPTGTFSPTEAGPPAECFAENKLIHVVTRGLEMYRFDPARLSFTKVGNLACDASGARPFSMAIDRAGTAWVLFSNGTLFTASTKDASCTATTYAPKQLDFSTFGMAFVTTAAGGSAERLFVADYDGKGLATIDTKALTLTAEAPLVGGAELTGTGEARMFAFLRGSASEDPKVVEVDETTGATVSERAMPGLEVGTAFAFAHWGGDFWLFTAPQGKSQVTRLKYDDGTVETVKTDVGFEVVGAGVSTCAPTTTPR
ncbi:MAG: hypothetical protein R3B36_31130 [Polyangiaceae bacterium]